MIDKNMIALAEIRYGYTLPKYGNLTLEQNSLIKYDNLCLKLIEENQKYKEVIDKIQKHCEIEINASNHYLENHSSQKELCHKVAHQRILDIMKEVE